MPPAMDAETADPDAFTPSSDVRFRTARGRSNKARDAVRDHRLEKINKAE